MTCFMNTSQPLSPAVGSWTKLPWWQRWKLCMGSATKTSTHQHQHGYSQYCTPNIPTAENNTESLIGTTHWDDQSTIWWHTDYMGWLSLWKMQCFVLTRIDTHSRYRLDILACNTFYQNDVQNASSTVMVVHIVLLLLKELTSQQMKFSNGPMLIKFTGLTMAPTILKRLVDRVMEWSFEDSVTVPAGWYIL